MALIVFAEDKTRYLLPLFLFCAAFSQFANCNSFVALPESVNTTLNSTITFNCSFNGTKQEFILAFRVDDVQADENSVIDKGFVEHIDTTSNGLLTGTLVATAYITNNNTKIECVVIDLYNKTSTHTIYSGGKYLIIQGLLHSVGNLIAVPINSTSISVTWTPPYTLDNVPITRYYIESHFININVSNTTVNVIIELPDTNSCIPINISVYAENKVGLGEATTTTVYYPSVPQVNDDTSILVKVKEKKEEYKYSLHVYVSNTICQGQYPAFAHVILINNEIDEMSTKVLSLQVSPNNPHRLIGNESISIPANFTVNVTLSNYAGEFSNNFKPIFENKPPGPVSNIDSSIDNNCTVVNLHWNSPKIFNDKVPLQHYNLLVYNEENMLIDNITEIEDTSYQFITNNIFHHKYTYVITAVNELGEGQSNNGTFTYLRVPKSATHTMLEVRLINEAQNAVVDYTIPVTFECPNDIEAPVNVTVLIFCGNASDDLYSHIHKVDHSKHITTKDGISIPRHEHCTLNVTFSNNVSTTEPLIREFSTFDVTAINVSVEAENSICVTCYLLSSYSIGCYVNATGTNFSKEEKLLLNKSPKPERLDRQRPTEASMISAEGCIYNLPPDNYTVTVYDLDNNREPILKELPVSPTAVYITSLHTSSIIVIPSITTIIISSTNTLITTSTITPTANPLPYNTISEIIFLTILGLILIIVISLICIVVFLIIRVWKKRHQEPMDPPRESNKDADDDDPVVLTNTNRSRVV